ncbi:hypothetical protein, partial [Paracraurococcus ruber]
MARADRGAFDIAFSGLAARDRLPPLRLRLADAAGTPMACAGLRLLGQDASRLCLTFSALPGEAEPGPATPGPAALREAAERAAREGGTLDLIELRDGGGPLAPSPEVSERIRETISA